MKILMLIFGVIFSMAAFANPRADIENKIVADLGKSLSQIKSPTAAIEKLRPRLKPQEVTYLETLIKNKSWVEMPTVTSEKNTLLLKFSNNLTMTLEVTNYWSGEFSLNGYKLEMDKYPHLEDQIAYLRRVVKSKVLPSENKGAGLLSLFLPMAQASLTCNTLVSTGCIEVSMATSLWLARASSEESPLRRCKEIYYFNKIDDVTKTCLMQYKNNPTLSAINEISEVLVTAPDTSVEISCNKDGEGPTIWINGSEVTRLGNGTNKSDYNITSQQDPKYRLRKLPELAMRCCRKPSGDPLAGSCEEFVNNQLGSKENRRKELNDPNLRIHGKEYQGVR